MRASEEDRAIEAWMSRRGLVLLLRGTAVGGGATARAATTLVVWYVIVMALMVPSTSLTWVSVVVIVVGVVVGTWLASNLIHRRQLFARVEDVGWFEALVFMLVPTALLAIVPLDLSDPEFADLGVDQDTLRALLVIAVFLTQLVVYTTVLLVTTLGLASVLPWLAREFAAAVTATGSTLSAALPVLLGVVFFFFLNPAVWVTIGRLNLAAYAGVIALLLLLAAAFLGSRGQLDVRAITDFETTEEVRAALRDTPLAQAPEAEIAVTERVRVPLGPRQLANLRFVAVVSRLVVALALALSVFVFFMVLGWLAVDADAIKGWTRVDPNVLFSRVTAGRTYIMSVNHLKVAGFVAAFAAFNYSLASASDARLRQGLKETAKETSRAACAIRLVLLRRNGTLSPAPPAATDR